MFSSSFKQERARFAKNITLDDDLFIQAREGMLPFGEFPRRVSQGEPVLHRGNCKILSPVNGIARNNPQGISISIDGNLQQKKNPENRDFSFGEILEKMEKYAVVSLDFPCKTLADYFQQAKEKDFDLVISPFSASGQINFAELIQTEFLHEFNQFKVNLMTVFRNSAFSDFLGPGKLRYKHPDGIAEYFIKSYTQYDPQKTLFLGAETVYYLLRALYQNIPFYQRYITVQFVTETGRLKTGEEIYLLLNGQSLSFLKSKIPDRYKYFTTNSIYDRNKKHDRNELFFIDILKHHSLLFFPEEKTHFSGCLDCMECNYLCPTNSFPYSLVRSLDMFSLERCIDCGICTVHCPGNIDISKKIQETRNGYST